METAPRPYIDLYRAAWPSDKRNTEPMQRERERVRAGVIAVLAQEPALTDDFNADERTAVQWQAVALALVDVLSPDALLEVLNILPGAFGGALKACVGAARIADFKGMDRGHVPLRSRSREEEPGLPPVPDYLRDQGAVARVRELEELLAEASDLFRFYEDNHRAKVTRFEAMRDSATDEKVRANISRDIVDTIEKANRNKAMAEKIIAKLTEG